MKLYEFSIYAFRLCGAALMTQPLRHSPCGVFPLSASTAPPLPRCPHYDGVSPDDDCLYGVAFTALPSRRCLHGVTYTTLPLRGCLDGVAFTAQSLTFYKLRKILRRRPQISLKTTEFSTDSINFPASRPTLQVIYLYFTRNLRILSSRCTSNLLDQKHVP